MKKRKILDLKYSQTSKQNTSTETNEHVTENQIRCATADLFWNFGK